MWLTVQLGLVYYSDPLLFTEGSEYVIHVFFFGASDILSTWWHLDAVEGRFRNLNLKEEVCERFLPVTLWFIPGVCCSRRRCRPSFVYVHSCSDNVRLKTDLLGAGRPSYPFLLLPPSSFLPSPPPPLLLSPDAPPRPPLPAMVIRDISSDSEILKIVPSLTCETARLRPEWKYL